jgi:predicted RNase H-like nuclease
MFGVKSFSGTSGAPVTRPEANRDAPPREGGSRVQHIWVAGVDGCRGGWFAVLVRVGSGSAPRSEARLVLCSSFSEVVSLPEKPAPIAVDIPIGLLDRAEPGGRTCDRAARVMLGRSRASSVFTPPTRTALQARAYREAMRMNGAGMSRQAFNIMGKIREVDELMQPNLQERVFEAHPELVLMGLAGRPMRHKKKTPAGWREREALVAPSFGRHYMEPSQVLDRFGRSCLATDDVLDAYALAITADRIHTSNAVRLPESEPDRDARGLRIEIWY